MKKFIVQLHDPKYIVNLQHLEKVGKPKTLTSFVIVSTDRHIDDLRAIDGVKSVDEDDRAQLESGIMQLNPPGWGLPWISNSGGTYENERQGAGVDIYVLDTGVRDTHEDLIGRVRTLWSFDGVPYSTTGDVSPTHGTSVAACAAGTKYGTAKLATVVNVRIDFFNSTIIKALDIILEDHLNKPADRQSVLNFSGSSPYPSMGEAFEKLVDYGVNIVAASGNYNESEPRYPAKSGRVVAVGALNEQEGPAYFTNRKSNVYAPGQNITTASVASDTAAHVTSGTSFSSPYYAGLLACQLEGSGKFNTYPLSSYFVHMSQMDMTDSDRIPSFPNGSGYAVRTVTTRNPVAPYYVPPSWAYSDQVITDFCVMYEAQPEVIALTALQDNVDLARLSVCTGYTPDVINGYFSAHNVHPWWFVDGAPLVAPQLVN